jgi:S-DNA-T family DNA segregation ATPase FtsK/SpoIIIE
MEIFGLGLFAMSGLLLIALITAGKNDPSWNQISSARVANWLGPVGANISAGLYAAIGLASFFLALVPLFWGLSYFRKQPVPWMRFRIIVLPLSLFFLAGGLFALDGGGASDNGGAAGAVIIGMIMRVMQPTPSFMGLDTVHYVGGAALFFGLLSWLWVVAISPRQWFKRSDRTSKIGLLVKGVAGLGQKVAGSVNNVQQRVAAKPPRKPKPSRQRQEPVLVADAAGHVADQNANQAAAGKAQSPRATKKNAK